MIGIALALAATLPFAALAWLAGVTIDRTVAEARLRLRLWTLLLALPVLAAAAIPAVASLPRPREFTPVDWNAAEPGPTARRAAPVAAKRVELDLDWLAPALLALVAGGCAVRLTALARRHRRLRRLMRDARPLGRDEVVAMLAEASRRMRVDPPPVLVADGLATPLLAGLRRPGILLPTALATAPAGRLAAICAHELEHRRRGDNAMRLAEDLLLALLWFNPALAAIRDRLAAAREEVCDASALAGASPATRRDYAEALVEALRAGRHGHPSPAFIGTGRSPHVMRLQAILAPVAPVSTRSRAVALALAAAAGVSLAAAGVALAAQVPQARVASSQIIGKTTAGDGGVTITSDVVLKLPDGRHRWMGRPSITFDSPSDAPEVRILVDGRPARPGFRADRMDPRTVRWVESRPPEAGAPMTLDISTFAGKYGDADAVALKAYCASDDVGEKGFCAGMLFVGLNDRTVCVPEGPRGQVEAVERARAVMATMPVTADDTPRDFALAAMRKAWPCA